MSSIVIPNFSFFRGEYNYPVNCEPLPRMCYPVDSFSNFAWQVLVTDLSSKPPVTERVVYALASKRSCADAASLPAYHAAWGANKFTLADNPGFEQLWHFSASTDMDWDTYNAGFENDEDKIQVGECFNVFIFEEIRHAFSHVVESRSLLRCTGCFQRVEGSCYTSSIIYSCNENAFGFIYKDSGITYPIFERVNLPFYLKEPQNPSEADIFQLSDQTSVKLFEVINEEWVLETMAMPFDWHRRFKIALAHDNIKIYNDNMRALAPDFESVNNWRFVAESDYKLKWQKPGTLAKGEGKVRNAEALNMRNLNCG